LVPSAVHITLPDNRVRHGPAPKGMFREVEIDGTK
jgi:hypothetical protein